jgi:hypothetical protein
MRGLLDSTVLGPSAATALMMALQAPDLPGKAQGLLKDTDCEAFARLALRQPLLPRAKFEALVLDFSLIARGEGSSDALMAYEL